MLNITIPTHLSDEQLMVQVTRLAHGEREAAVQLVAHLAEFDARRLYLGAGYSSLFAYCCGVLRLSEDAAYNRIETARAVKRFPVILARLADGTLNVTTVRLLARRLTPENHTALLAEASGRSKREVEEVVARHDPQPDVPATVRKVPVRPAGVAAVLKQPSIVEVPPPTQPTIQEAASSPAPPPAPRPTVAPLAEDRYLVKFTVSGDTRRKLRLAQELLSHAVPGGDPAEIFDRALTLLIEDVKRKRFAATKHPRRDRGVAPGSHRVPASIKRRAVERDDQRCGFVGTTGHRCGERAFLQFHHVEPVASGGLATIGKIEMRCKAHNDYEAELAFGGTVNLKSVQHGPDRVACRRSGAVSSPYPLNR